MGVLTVQVTVPDALHVFSVDEVVASLPYDVYGGQIHIVTNPMKRRHRLEIRRGKIGKRSNDIETNLLTSFILQGTSEDWALKENPVKGKSFLEFPSRFRGNEPN